MNAAYNAKLREMEERIETERHKIIWKMDDFIKQNMEDNQRVCA